MDWRLIRTKRYERCCRYAGTDDCPPCAGPSSSWRINQASPGKRDSQQVWLFTPGDSEVFAVGNFRMEAGVSSTPNPRSNARISTKENPATAFEARNPAKPDCPASGRSAQTVQIDLGAFFGQ